LVVPEARKIAVREAGSSAPGHTSCRRRARLHCGAWGCVVPEAR